LVDYSLIKYLIVIKNYKSDDSRDESNVLNLKKGAYTEEEILKNLSKTKTNPNIAQNILKNIEERILKEREKKQTTEDVNNHKNNEKEIQMIIEDQAENDFNLVINNEFNTNRISPNIDDITNENINNNNNSSKIYYSAKLNSDNNFNFGHKRSFEEFSKSFKRENTQYQNMKYLEICNSPNNKLNNNNIINNKNIDLNKNFIGFSRCENPFIPKSTIKLNNLDTNNIKIAKESIFNPNKGENKNIRSKKVIPFTNNSNNLGFSASLETDNQNNLSILMKQIPTLDQNNIENINLNNIYSGFQNNTNIAKREKPNSAINYFNFGTFNSNFPGISSRDEKEVFSKALINNKIYTEDNNQFIQVGGQGNESKKPNYREGLFDDNENTSYNILKNNFGKLSVNSAFHNRFEQNQILNNINKENLDISDADDNKEKADTDEDPEEIKIVEQILQKYLEEGKVINDKKIKLSLIRKIAPYYKVLTLPNYHEYLIDTIEKLKTIINEEKSEVISSLLNYEYLKSLREKVFQKFCKMINKFFLKLNDNKIKEFGGENYNLEIPESLKERLKNIYTKINDYFDKNSELE